MLDLKKKEIHEQGNFIETLYPNRKHFGNIRVKKIKKYQCSFSARIRERCVLPYIILLEAQIDLEYLNEPENCLKFKKGSRGKSPINPPIHRREPGKWASQS